MIGLNDASILKEWWQTSFSLSYSVVKRMEQVVILYCCDSRRRVIFMHGVPPYLSQRQWEKSGGMPVHCGHHDVIGQTDARRCA